MKYILINVMYYGEHNHILFLIPFQIAQFKVYVTIVDSIFPLFLSFYMGAWADLFGRRNILYISVMGQLIGQIGIMFTAIFMDWPKEIYLIAFLPKAVFGKKLFFMIP